MLTIILVALTSSFSHCALMCGGFCLAVARGGYARLVLYHIARTAAYALLGAVSFGVAGAVTLGGVSRGAVFFAVGVLVAVVGVAIGLRGRFLAFFERGVWVFRAISWVRGAGVSRGGGDGGGASGAWGGLARGAGNDDTGGTAGGASGGLAADTAGAANNRGDVKSGGRGLFSRAFVGVGGWISRAFGGAGRAAVLGFLNGFLPCGMLYYLLGNAATAASVWDAVAQMAAFGVFSSPAFFALGLLGVGAAGGRGASGAGGESGAAAGLDALAFAESSAANSNLAGAGGVSAGGTAAGAAGAAGGEEFGAKSSANGAKSGAKIRDFRARLGSVRARAARWLNLICAGLIIANGIFLAYRGFVMMGANAAHSHQMHSHSAHETPRENGENSHKTHGENGENSHEMAHENGENLAQNSPQNATPNATQNATAPSCH